MDAEIIPLLDEYRMSDYELRQAVDRDLTDMHRLEASIERKIQEMKRRGLITDEGPEGA